MARRKLALEFIAKDKARKATFEKRKKGLMKKAEEFAILCGVDTCVILYGPADTPSSEAMVWPKDTKKGKQVIHRYLNEDFDRRTRHAVGLPEFFMNRGQKIEKELKKIRLANLAAKFPVSDEPLNGLSHDQIRVLMSVLGMKLENVKKRLLAAKESTTMNMSSIIPFHMDQFNSSVLPQMNDYMQMESTKPSFEFQQLMMNPLSHQMVDTNLMTMNGSMECPHLVTDGTGSSSSILSNHHISNNYYYNGALTIPAYNGTFLDSGPPFKIPQNLPCHIHQYEQIRGAQPTTIVDSKFNSPTHDMLGNSSMRMVQPLQQHHQHLQYPMLPPPVNSNPSHFEQGNMMVSLIGSSDHLKAQTFHDNGDRVYQFCTPNGGV